MKLNKKYKDAEFWPRLLQDKTKEKTNVKIDWDKYVDEDEAEGKDFDMGALDGGMDFSNMDFSKMMADAGGMGGAGFPGAGDNEEDADDSDDEENLPDLEQTEN